MAKECYAPVFAGTRNVFGCLILIIFYTLVIILILIATLFLCPLFHSCRCLIKQYIFRMRHCTQGNSDPARPI